jgi:WD40 repeat protein
MQVERVLRIDIEARSLVAIDATKRYIVTTADDGKVTRWDIRKGSSDVLRGHLRRATCIAFSPRSDLLCTGSYDHSLRLWNMDGCECIASLEGHEDEISCAAFDSRGRMVCSGSADKSLKLWRVMDGYAPTFVVVNHMHSDWLEPRLKIDGRRTARRSYM